MNISIRGGWLVWAGLCLGAVVSANGAETAGNSATTNAQPRIATNLPPRQPSIWAGEVGQGFLRSVQHVGVFGGAGVGMRILGSRGTHDMALGGVSYGRMWGDVKGEGHFYRGNWEWRTELFGGGQFKPKGNYVVGVAPHIRYNLATGSRFVPFLDLGVGATATDIHEPDLGGVFQFNLQSGGGVNYFLRDNLALSLEYRFLHLSSARISTPNLGVNTSMIMVGLNWFF